MFGVSVDVSSEALDAVSVSNRKDQVEDIGAASTYLVGRQGARERVAGLVWQAAVFGGSDFAQILGRSGKLALADLSYLERLNATSVHLDDE